MKDKLKNAAVKVGNHVKNNKFGYAMTGVAITMVAVQLNRASDLKVFLIEKGIDPMEFLNPENYAELNS